MSVTRNTESSEYDGIDMIELDKIKYGWTSSSKEKRKKKKSGW